MWVLLTHQGYLYMWACENEFQVVGMWKFSLVVILTKYYELKTHTYFSGQILEENQDNALQPENNWTY